MPEPRPNMLSETEGQISRAKVSRRGYLLLFLSVIFNAIGVHTTKTALIDSTPLTVALIVLVSTFAMFLLLGWCWRRLGWTAGAMHLVCGDSLRTCFRASPRLVLVASLFATLGAWLVNVSVQRYGPETTAFLMNLTLAFLVISGCALGERLSGREAGCIALLVGGAFLYSYRGGSLASGALVLTTMACGVVAGKQLLVKHIATDSPLPVAICMMTGLSVVWTTLLLLGTGQWQLTRFGTFGYAVLSALACSVLGMLLLYRAYQLVGVARGAPFDALRPIAVLLLGLAFGHAAPTSLQIAGGVTILMGSVGLTLWHQQPLVPSPIPVAATDIEKQKTPPTETVPS
jgi:drug/metabolite transporter (DMT)-like permease